MIMKDLFFALKPTNSFFTRHTGTCKSRNESLCQLAGIWEVVTTLSEAGEQEYKPKAAVLRLLFKTPLTEMAQSYNSRGLRRLHLLGRGGVSLRRKSLHLYWYWCTKHFSLASLTVQASVQGAVLWQRKSIQVVPAVDLSLTVHDVCTGINWQWWTREVSTW